MKIFNRIYLEFLYGILQVKLLLDIFYNIIFILQDEELTKGEDYAKENCEVFWSSFNECTVTKWMFV